MKYRSTVIRFLVVLGSSLCGGTIFRAITASALFYGHDLGAAFIVIAPAMWFDGLTQRLGINMHSVLNTRQSAVTFNTMLGALLFGLAAACWNHYTKNKHED